MGFKQWSIKRITFLFEYDTPRITTNESKSVGILCRFIQLATLGVFVGYYILHEKGYQRFDETVDSVVTAKVNGVVFTNSTLPGVGKRIWDAADYVVPPHEANAFFVMTNMVVTPNQTLGTCPEDPTKKDVRCTIDSDCPAGAKVVMGNGVRTGKCVPSDQGNGTVCEIYAWCPVEKDYTPNPALLRDSADFTVSIKNSIEYNKFKYTSDTESTVYRLGNIVSEAGEKYDELAYKGGVMAIEINWDCNLDSKNKCKPKYSFRRLNKQKSSGWNFRFSNVYMDNGVQTRTLTNAYGILFNILVTGTGRKFHFFTFILKLGSFLALQQIALSFFDFILFYVLPHCCSKLKDYKAEKVHKVKWSDAFKACNDGTPGQSAALESANGVEERDTRT